MTPDEIIKILVNNEHMCYHCDPDADINIPPAGNTLWEEPAVYTCEADGRKLEGVFVSSIDGDGFYKVAVKGDKLFVVGDKIKQGKFTLIYRLPTAW